MRTAAMDDYFFNEIKSHPMPRAVPPDAEKPRTHLKPRSGDLTT